MRWLALVALLASPADAVPPAQPCPMFSAGWTIQYPNQIVSSSPITSVGYNPVGVTAAANVGASPATITAGPSPETHYIKQSATFNATVAKGGQTICGDTVAAVPCVVQLGPDESYVVTWTTTQPTYVKDVH